MATKPQTILLDYIDISYDDILLIPRLELPNTLINILALPSEPIRLPLNDISAINTSDYSVYSQ